MLLLKKELIQVDGVGKINNYCEDIYIPPYNSTQLPHLYIVTITIDSTHQPHPPPANPAHQPHPQIPPTLQNCRPQFSHPYCTEVWTTILECGWNLWVWIVGVVSRRWVWLVGGIYGYGYNVQVWLVGVVVRRYIDILTIIINFPYSIHLYQLFFWQQHPYFFVHFFSFFKNKKVKWQFFTSHGAHLNCTIMAMLYIHSIGNQTQNTMVVFKMHDTQREIFPHL